MPKPPYVIRVFFAWLFSFTIMVLLRNTLMAEWSLLPQLAVGVVVLLWVTINLEIGWNWIASIGSKNDNQERETKEE